MPSKKASLTPSPPDVDAVVPVRRKRSRVCIVGYGSSGRLVPWTEYDTDFWGFNEPGGTSEPARNISSFGEWFQLHHRNYLERTQRNPGAMVYFQHSLEWYRALRYTPLYVWEPKDWPECLTAKAFPKTEVEALTPHGRYHLSSVDWLVALAIYRGYEHISVYGIDFGPTDGGEPMGARACLEYWLGVAEGRGITTHVEGGAMFHGYQWVRSDWQYGYEHANNEVRQDRPVEG